MEKRLPLALFLSFLILITWRVLSAPPQREVLPTQPASTAVAPQELVAVPTVEVSEAAERWNDWVLIGQPGQPGCYWARFDNLGGTLRELRIEGFWNSDRLDPPLREERDNWVQLLDELDTGSGTTGSFLWGTRQSSAALAPKPLETVLWEHTLVEGPDGTPLGITFTHEPGTGVRFRKTIRSRPGSYDLEVELGIENLSFAKPLEANTFQFVFTPAACMPGAVDDSYYPEPRVVAVWRTERGGEPDLEEKARVHGSGDIAGPLKAHDLISFVGAQGKYFAVLMRAAGLDDRSMLGAGWRRVYDADWVREHPGKESDGWRSIVADVELALVVPPAGAPESVTHYLVYAGPKSRDILVADHPDHAKLVDHDLGYFSGIARFLLLILGFFHRVTGNWGWAIILLTFSVRLVLFPLNRRSQTAMARHATKMKRVQPKLDEAKERYKNDRPKLQKEQARIMQEEGALPPLGGCLPVFLQIPVFFGLFAALRSNFDLRQAPFHLWIHDLSEPDRMFRIDLTLPLIGSIPYLNVLPPLMVGLWILQQRFMPKPTDPQQASMQRMMMWMPILMGFFLYNYAAGLSLYMITQSALGIFELAVIKRFWPVDTTEKKSKRRGWLARFAELQKQAQEMQRSGGQRPTRDKLVRSAKKRR